MPIRPPVAEFNRNFYFQVGGNQYDGRIPGGAVIDDCCCPCGDWGISRCGNCNPRLCYYYRVSVGGCSGVGGYAACNPFPIYTDLIVRAASWASTTDCVWRRDAAPDIRLFWDGAKWVVEYWGQCDWGNCGGLNLKRAYDVTFFGLVGVFAPYNGTFTVVADPSDPCTWKWPSDPSKLYLTLRFGAGWWQSDVRLHLAANCEHAFQEFDHIVEPVGYGYHSCYDSGCPGNCSGATCTVVESWCYAKFRKAGTRCGGPIGTYVYDSQSVVGCPGGSCNVVGAYAMISRFSG